MEPDSHCSATYAFCRELTDDPLEWFQRQEELADSIAAAHGVPSVELHFWDIREGPGPWVARKAAGQLVRAIGAPLPLFEALVIASPLTAFECSQDLIALVAMAEAREISFIGPGGPLKRRSLAFRELCAALDQKRQLPFAVTPIIEGPSEPFAA